MELYGTGRRYIRLQCTQNLFCLHSMMVLVFSWDLLLVFTFFVQKIELNERYSLISSSTVCTFPVL